MKDIIEKVNIVEALVVIVSGAALVAAVVTGQQDIALAAVGGLVGYLGHGAQTALQNKG